ncbi:MAG: hypothetical protein IPN79_09695 [Saprospiraceae bacterium]|nr:hypothetical protein [Saprospiraceae bacterium]
MTSRIVEGLFGVLRKILRFIRLGFVPLIKSISVIIIIALILSGVSLLVSISLGSPVLRIFGPDSYFINQIGIISLFFLVAAPIFGLIVFFLRLGFKTKVKREVSFTVWTVWFIALFAAFYSGTMTGIDYKHREVLSTSSDLTINSKEIFINTWDENLDLNNLAQFVEVPLKIKGDSLYFHNVSVIYKTTDSPFITIEKVAEARALNQPRANERVKSINAPYKIEGNKIMISPWMRMPQDSKWRAHQIHYTIYVPKDINVHFNYNQNNPKPINIGYTR